MNLLRSEFVNILETADREELPIRDGLHEHLDQGKDIVLFGAGNLGQQLAEKLLRAGVNVLCFCDNRESLWGSAIHSLPVLSPADAVSRYGASA